MAETSGRTLVTGASSGIGAEFARALRARGHSVILVARRRERLEKLATELGGEPHAVVEPCDLAQEGAAEWLRVRLAERELEIDRVVNCQGLGHTSPYADQPSEVVRAMCDVNVRALVELTRLFLPPMLERRRGFVINDASNAEF
jgi:short-subunit dehydrogenase